ncbi:LLM class flavin-dependent oxidoreductase [Hansschlegelia quercus]|uniref:LLM class flavin-dependent oxidoreductase n=1 Tax=Hansschlegelia quercus TaxID=2528245 RepID=A0A4Q9GF96_9HYPH|nr:LLM class flavin-dependent oxidoreductase [Hansschlegelia quercus]TBN48742.1 LLM class flavin-dependent oxidoreductase [Hansschlegelia quercus]
MAKEILFNAFSMNAVGHQSPGLWRHPRDRSGEFNRLSFWTDLAKTLEAGLFDGLFLADVLGVYDVYGASPAAALRHGTQVPSNDPALLVPAMAAVTRHLGFGVTSNLTYEPPFPFARRMSTLDHLTKGRIGWNVVTGYLDSAARAAGLAKQRGHDDRYAVAEEYMDVVYSLWEGSWDDDAAVRDAARGVFADPAKVRPAVYRGRHFSLDAVHLSEPSPQRTPVLYQAGSSPAGRAFAARHAECVFMSGPSVAALKPRVADIRRLAAEAGRDPSAIKIFALATVVTGPTDAAAETKLADFRRYVSPEGALTLMSGWTGVDLSTYQLDEEVRHVETDAGRTAMENITRADPSRVWTVRQVAEQVGIGGIGPIFVGSPATVANLMETWIAETGVDGFNLAYAIAPETFEDIVEHVVPELQRRGRYKRAYVSGTLREKLVGGGPRLPRSHPAAGFRPSRDHAEAAE